MRGLLTLGKGPISPNQLALVTFFASIMCFSTGNIITKFVDVGPTASAFYRLFLAMPMGWAWLQLMPLRPSQTSLQEAGLLKISALGIGCGVFFGAEIGLLHHAYAQGSVGIAIFFNGLSPFFVILASWILFGEKPGWKAPLCLLVAAPGVFMLVSSGNGAIHFSTGDMAALASAACLAGFLLCGSRLRRYRSATSVMNWTNVTACLFLAPIAVLNQEQLFPAGYEGWIILIVLAFISQVLGMKLYTTTMGILSPTVLSISTLTQPVLTMAMAWVVLGEALTTIQVLGAAIVLLAIGYNNLPARKQKTS